MNSGHRRRRSPGIGATFDERYEATTLVPRAKQAPRRIPVRWYPTHGYQHERPSHLQAPSLSMTRGLLRTFAPKSRAHDPPIQIPLDSGSHINARHSPADGRADAGPAGRRNALLGEPIASDGMLMRRGCLAARVGCLIADHKWCATRVSP